MRFKSLNVVVGGEINEVLTFTVFCSESQYSAVSPEVIERKWPELNLNHLSGENKSEPQDDDLLEESLFLKVTFTNSLRQYNASFISPLCCSIHIFHCCECSLNMKPVIRIRDSAYDVAIRWSYSNV